MPLEMPPFPTLTWSGWSWTAAVTLAGFAQGGPAPLEVRLPLGRRLLAETDAPHPSAEQAAAYRLLLGDGPGVWAALLTAVRDRVPEWAEWPLGRVSGEVELGRLTVHAPARDGAAYTGFWLGAARVDSWLTEHGAGVTAHRYRVVAVGMGEESREPAAAEADVRRLRRAHRGPPPRREVVQTPNQALQRTAGAGVVIMGASSHRPLPPLSLAFGGAAREHGPRCLGVPSPAASGAASLAQGRRGPGGRRGRVGRGSGAGGGDVAARLARQSAEPGAAADTRRPAGSS